jgi:hypothetical protein
MGPTTWEAGRDGILDTRVPFRWSAGNPPRVPEGRQNGHRIQLGAWQNFEEVLFNSLLVSQ